MSEASSRRAWWRHLPFLVAALALIATDQWVKVTIARAVEDGRYWRPYPVLGGLFHIRYATNTGGAFGVFAGETVSIGLIVISIVALLFIGWYYWLYRDSIWMRAALTLVAGGAMGNFIDRIRLRYVIDYIDIDLGSYQWPYFNLADTFISSGAALLVLYLVWERIRETRRERADDAA